MDYKTGMFVYALAFLLGVILVQQFAVLPDSLFLISLLCLFVICIAVLSCSSFKEGCAAYRYFTLIIQYKMLFIFGITYATVFAGQQLSHRLNENMVGKNIVIRGLVSSIPLSNGRVQSFEFDIEQIKSIDSQIETSTTESESPKKIKLNWYYGLPVNAGEKWQLVVRLKPPHGFLNPGGFDYEAWLFQHGIHAVGYVRKSRLNQALYSELNVNSRMKSVNRMRQSLAEKIDGLADNDSTNKGDRTFSLIKALAIGDKSSISSSQWRVLTNTGTSHLMAISGLHIGLAMLFFYMFIRRSLPAFVMKQIPAQCIAVTGGAVAACAYALIAGLSIPTQRAIIMLLVLSVMMLIRRNHRSADALGLAVFLVLLFDPLAVLSIGFWFSFSAVAVIFISVKSANYQQDVSAAQRIFSICITWLRLQLLISIFLLPLSLFMFQQASLVSPLANLLLIPYVSFLVVPVVLLAIMCSYFAPLLADYLFNLAAILLDYIWPILSYLSELPYALLVKGDVGILGLLQMTAAILIIYFSSDLGLFAARKSKRLTRYTYCWLFRVFAVLLCLPLAFMTQQPELKAGEYQVAVLDVGQGSAAVLQTSNHVLVFDSGAKFSEKLDAGKSVVIPYLRFQGFKLLDMLIISHGDADHIGGAAAILNEFPDTSVMGQGIENLNVANKTLCSTGQHWQWDGVDFSILSPEAVVAEQGENRRRNDLSCVLKVSSPAGSVLFTGDIEKKAENYLLQRYASQLKSEVLIVPHHGSSTSSGIEFIEAIKPKLSIISAGYKNRYKLPSSKVIARYEQMDSSLLNTANLGAVTFRMRLNEDFTVSNYRQTATKYWHHVLD